MRIKPLQSLQHLQDAYSSLCGLTIMIMDQEDNRLTEPSGLSEIVKLLLGYQQKSIEDSILNILDKVKDIQKPIVYETITGFKLLIAPIKVKEQTPYYIFAGVTVDESNIKLIESRIFEDLPTQVWETWKAALVHTPTYGQKQVGKILIQLEELAEMIRLLLDQGVEKGKHANRLQLLNLVHLMDSGDPKWLQGVLGVFARVMELEFAGFARNLINEEQFTVIETIGFKENATLQDASFSLGEGFLGQIGLTRQMGYWERSDWDPRVSFFTKQGIEPKVIICYPIKYQNQFFGLLFGADSSVQELTEEQADTGALLANQLAADFYYLENEAYNERRKIRMKAFEEVTQGILGIKDKAAFFQMLIDSIQRTVQTSFICMLLKEQKEKVTSVYLCSNQSEDMNIAYVENAESTYFMAGSSGLRMLRKPLYRQWNEVELLELPLVFEQKIFGVVGLVLEGDAKNIENMPFLNAINAIVLTKLQLETGLTLVSKADTVTLLHQNLLILNPEAFYKAMKVKELAQSFLKHMNGSLEEIERIAQASLLSDYEPALLSSCIGETSVVSLLREVRQYRSGKKNEAAGAEPETLLGKILLIVIWYCEQGDKEKTWILTLPISIEDHLLRSFEYFLSSQTELGALPLLESKGRLTQREDEILHHVLHGLTNLEIAEKLFISTHTVKNHITKIFGKLEVNGRAQAIAKIYQKTSWADPTQKR